MTHYGPHYLDGTPLELGDRVKFLGWTDDFEVRSYHVGGIVIANVTPGFTAIGTSTVPLDRLSFVRRAENAS